VLQRDLDFRSFSIRTIIATSTGGLLGLIVAFAGYGVWALITKQIISDLVGLMVLWRLSRWRPHLRLSVAAIRQLLGFSLAGFAGNIGLYFNAQSDALLIGLFFGPVSVGLYRLASRVTSSVITATTSSLQVASFPQFCKLQDKPDELRKSVLSCFRVSSIVTIPALVGIAAISKWLMLAMGPKWVDASTGVVILCVVGILQQPVYFVGTFLQAIAKPHYLAVIEWAHAAVSAGSLLAASILLKDQVVSVQVTGIAITRLITTVLFLLPLLIYVLRKYARITVSAAMQVMRPSLLAATATGLAVVLITLAGLLQNFKLWTAIAIQVALGGAAGVAVLLWLDNALRNAVDDLVRRMRRQAAPAGTTGSGIGCNAAEVNR
jgi:PST family polysaccharide transporter